MERLIRQANRKKIIIKATKMFRIPKIRRMGIKTILITVMIQRTWRMMSKMATQKKIMITIIQLLRAT